MRIYELWNSITFLIFKASLAINPSPPRHHHYTPSVIMMYCLQKSIFDAPLRKQFSRRVFWYSSILSTLKTWCKEVLQSDNRLGSENAVLNRLRFYEIKFLELHRDMKHRQCSSDFMNKIEKRSDTVLFPQKIHVSRNTTCI